MPKGLIIPDECAEIDALVPTQRTSDYSHWLAQKRMEAIANTGAVRLATLTERAGSAKFLQGNTGSDFAAVSALIEKSFQKQASEDQTNYGQAIQYMHRALNSRGRITPSLYHTVSQLIAPTGVIDADRSSFVEPLLNVAYDKRLHPLEAMVILGAGIPELAEFNTGKKRAARALGHVFTSQALLPLPDFVLDLSNRVAYNEAIKRAMPAIEFTGEGASAKVSVDYQMLKPFAKFLAANIHAGLKDYNARH